MAITSLRIVDAIDEPDTETTTKAAADDTLENVAKAVLHVVAQIERTEQKADDYRATAGALLESAKKRLRTEKVNGRKVTWSDWCYANLTYTNKDGKLARLSVDAADLYIVHHKAVDASLTDAERAAAQKRLDTRKELQRKAIEAKRAASRGYSGPRQPRATIAEPNADDDPMSSASDTTTTAEPTPPPPAAVVADADDHTALFEAHCADLQQAAQPAAPPPAAVVVPTLAPPPVDAPAPAAGTLRLGKNADKAWADEMLHRWNNGTRAAQTMFCKMAVLFREGEG